MWGHLSRPGPGRQGANRSRATPRAASTSAPLRIRIQVEKQPIPSVKHSVDVKAQPANLFNITTKRMHRQAKPPAIIGKEPSVIQTDQRGQPDKSKDPRSPLHTRCPASSMLNVQASRSRTTARCIASRTDARVTTSPQISANTAPLPSRCSTTYRYVAFTRANGTAAFASWPSLNAIRRRPMNLLGSVAAATIDAWSIRSTSSKSR